MTPDLPNISELDSEQLAHMLNDMDLATLDVVIARATELRAQRHTEEMAKLQKAAAALGATLTPNGKEKKRRGRKPKDEAVE